MAFFFFSEILSIPAERNSRPGESPRIRPALLILLFSFDVDRRIVGPGWNVEQSGVRAVGRRIPIRPALISWVNERPLRSWNFAGDPHRPALLIKAVHPVHLD